MSLRQQWKEFSETTQITDERTLLVLYSAFVAGFGIATIEVAKYGFDAVSDDFHEVAHTDVLPQLIGVTPAEYEASKKCKH